MDSSANPPYMPQSTEGTTWVFILMLLLRDFHIMWLTVVFITFALPFSTFPSKENESFPSKKVIFKFRNPSMLSYFNILKPADRLAIYNKQRALSDNLSNTLRAWQMEKLMSTRILLCSFFVALVLNACPATSQEVGKPFLSCIHGIYSMYGCFSFLIY